MLLFIALLSLLLAMILWAKKLSDDDNYGCYIAIFFAGIFAIALVCDIVYEIYKHVSVTFS